VKISVIHITLFNMISSFSLGRILKITYKL